MKCFFWVFLISALFAAPAFAVPTVTFTGMGYSGTYSGFGGEVHAGEMEFTASGFAEVADGLFTTFCIEADEYVTVGQTYDAILNTEAVQGGIGSPGSDPLSDETAWLYDNYLTNVLGSSSDDLAEDYQMAIWFLEEEITVESELSTVAQTLVSDAKTAVGSNWTNTTIKVLNLYVQGTSENPGEGDYIQDVLVRVTSNTSPVIPAPGAVLLGGIGIALVGWLRRRRTL